MTMEKPVRKELLITRTFNAPLSLVWLAHSEAEHLAKWWGPAGMKLLIRQLEFRPGGLFHYGMQMPDGNTMWGRFVYREIVPQQKLVFINSFSDENAGITRAPFNPHWPLEVLNHWTFEEKDGRTTLTLRGMPWQASAEEHAAFEGHFASMNQGFNATFDQLDAWLAGR